MGLALTTECGFSLAELKQVGYSGLSFWLSFKVYLIACPSVVLSFCLSDIECCVFFCVKSFDS